MELSMNKFTVTQSRFKNIQGAVAAEAAAESGGVVEAIIKVREPGYVPAGVMLCARLDPYMLTAEVRSDALAGLDEDPKVEAVSIGRSLRIID